MNTKANVLVIDDEEVVRMSLRRALDEAECNVEVAGSGRAGLSLLNRGPVDVVLLDLRMPGMDGVEVLETIKRRWPETEVIVITGYPAVDSVKQAIRLGAYDYLAKPVGPDEVTSAAHAAVQHKRFALRHDADGRTVGEPATDSEQERSAVLPLQPGPPAPIDREPTRSES